MLSEAEVARLREAERPPTLSERLLAQMAAAVYAMQLKMRPPQPQSGPVAGIGIRG
jgi:hypothetical protein